MGKIDEITLKASSDGRLLPETEKDKILTHCGVTKLHNGWGFL